MENTNSNTNVKWSKKKILTFVFLLIFVAAISAVGGIIEKSMQKKWSVDWEIVNFAGSEDVSGGLGYDISAMLNNIEELQKCQNDYGNSTSG